MRLITRLISTGLGVGYSPVAPGTAGSFLIIVIYWLLPEINNAALLLYIVVLFFIGVYSASITEEEMIRQMGPERGHDASIIVIDEIIGMLIAVFAVPKHVYYLIAAFILFRLFDITKPFPANRSQKLPKGWGIMIDDIVAGVYANILIQFFLIINKKI